MFNEFIDNTPLAVSHIQASLQGILNIFSWRRYRKTGWILALKRAGMSPNWARASLMWTLVHSCSCPRSSPFSHSVLCAAAGAVAALSVSLFTFLWVLKNLQHSSFIIHMVKGAHNERCGEIFMRCLDNFLIRPIRFVCMCLAITVSFFYLSYIPSRDNLLFNGKSVCKSVIFISNGSDKS